MKLVVSFMFLVAIGTSRALLIDTLLDVANYQTDYGVVELLRLFANFVRLTCGGLFNTLDDVPIEEDVTFYCINRDTNEMQQTYMNDSDLASKINLSKPVAFVIHGWIDNINRTWMQEIPRYWIEYQDINVCGVDWSRLANYEYSLSAKNHTKSVGKFLAVFIRYLQDEGLNLENVTLAGHSLGGQIAGYTGAEFGGQLPIIFAMDPAGPFFTHPTLAPIDERLDPTDAQHVQALYTTTGILGVSIAAGHSNFYPNSGRAIQPGCYLGVLTDAPAIGGISCSHSLSHVFFRYALNPALPFIGTECSSYANYLIGGCSGKVLKDSVTSRFGIYSDFRPGTYYLQTNREAPYAKI